MMETFEIKREDDGTSLGNFRARPEGKLVSEVLKNMIKKGHDGVLLDDTTELTDTDLLTPGHIYKFRQSIHIDAPSAAGLSFCKLPQQVKEVADEYESSWAKKPKLFDGIDDSKLRIHHQQAPEYHTSCMSEPIVTNSLQKKLQSASRRVDLILPVMVAQCKVLVEEYFLKGILEFALQELKERYKMRFGFKLDQKVVGFESMEEFLQHAMPGRSFRSLFKGGQQFIICDMKCLDQNFLRTLQHPIYSNRDHSASKITKEEVRAWLENLVASGRASSGIDLSHIHCDFQNVTSKPLDYKSLHCGSLMKLIMEFGDLVRFERCGCRIIVFPQDGMYRKQQMKVVNNITPRMQQEKIIKPAGTNYIRPKKTPHMMKQINPGVPPIPPECGSEEVVPIYIHKPQNPPSPSPTPNTLEVRAVAMDTSQALREREIKTTLLSISDVLIALDKDRERIRHQNIATNTAIKKRMALSGLTCGALLEDSGDQDFNSRSLEG